MSVYVRELSLSDLPILNKWRNDKNSIESLCGNFRYIGSEVDKNWYDSYQKTRSNNIRLGVFCSDSNEIIGVTYLLNIDWVNRNAEFAIWLWESNYKGKGIGTYVTKLMIRHAFNDLNLHRVYLTVLNSNTVALRLYNKVGFESEGILKDFVFKNGSYESVNVMSIINN